MKKVNIAYWVVTILFVGFMIFSSIGNITSDKQSVDFISGQMHYPEYLIPFLGVAKVLACIVVLIPGFPRLKEWAYAGLAFDLCGALYSFIALHYPFSSMIFMFLIIGFLFASYFLYHAKSKAK